MADSRRIPEPDWAQGENGQEDFYRDLVTIQDPASVASDAYRMLRTNILYSFVDDPPKTIVLTSAGVGEGKSIVCANLGVVLAQAGKSTLLVDCNFRSPAIYELFGLHHLPGITEVLTSERSLQEVLNEPVAGLKVVTTGTIVPNSSEFLSTQRFGEFLASTREKFDYVLIDTPSVSLAPDPAVLALQGDGVILVVDAQNTPAAAIQRAMRNLQAVGANVLGTVMNNVRAW